MAKQKSLEQLRAEKEQVEKRLAQEQHKLERLENRKKYLEKGERQKRTHRLCNLGGTIEALPRRSKSHTHRNDRADGTHLRSAGGTESRPAHGDYTLNQANRGKGLKANGTIPLHSNPNETQ